MAGAWGISKVMAEIHALLYMSSAPLSLEEMSEKLKTSRSNISINVRSLQDLGVVKKVIIRGNRKDYYTVEEDLIKVARRLVAEKKKRELDTAIEIVDEAIAAAGTQDQNSSPNNDPSLFYFSRFRALKFMMTAISEIFESFIEGNSFEAVSQEDSKTRDDKRLS